MASERSALEHIRRQNPAEALRLSREERDHVAGHARDSMQRLASSLAGNLHFEHNSASTEARKIAARNSKPRGYEATK